MTPVDETALLAPEEAIGTYKLSKTLAERTVFEMIQKDKLPAIIVNPTTPIVPRGIRPTPTGRMLIDAARGRIPAFVDTGLNFAHVDDIAEGLFLRSSMDASANVTFSEARSRLRPHLESRQVARLSESCQRIDNAVQIRSATIAEFALRFRRREEHPVSRHSQRIPGQKWLLAGPQREHFYSKRNGEKRPARQLDFRRSPPAETCYRGKQLLKRQVPESHFWRPAR